jgi:hypothetical protein
MLPPIGRGLAEGPANSRCFSRRARIPQERSTESWLCVMGALTIIPSISQRDACPGEEQVLGKNESSCRTAAFMRHEAGTGIVHPF